MTPYDAYEFPSLRLMTLRNDSVTVPLRYAWNYLTQLWLSLWLILFWMIGPVHFDVPEGSMNVIWCLFINFMRIPICFSCQTLPCHTASPGVISNFSPIFPTFHQFSQIFPTFQHFFILFTSFLHFSLFTTFNNFSTLFLNFPYLSFSTTFPYLSSLSTLFTTFSYFSPPFPTFHHFLPLFLIFHSFLPLFTTFPYFSPLFSTFPHFSPNVWFIEQGMIEDTNVIGDKVKSRIKFRPR